MSAFSYLYDHLGNTRVVYTASFNCATPTTQTRTLELMSDYYPFGKVLRAFDPAPADEKYLMTQKERDSETGLDYFGARYYDSDVCRWLSVDPLADKYPGWSVYNYVLGNPIRLIDPDGAGVDNTIFVDNQGNELLRTEDGLDDAIVVVDHPYGIFSIYGSYYSRGGYTDAEVRNLRNFGYNYMVDGMKELLALSISEIAHGGDLNYYDKDLIPVSLHPEYSTGMSVNGLIISLKISEATSMDSPSDSHSFPNQLMAHTHPDGYRPDIKFAHYKSGIGLTDTGGYRKVTTLFGGSPGAPPSTGDQLDSIFKRKETRGTYDNQPNFKFAGQYDVVSSPTKIHLFNGTTTISVPLSFFK